MFAKDSIMLYLDIFGFIFDLIKKTFYFPWMSEAYPPTFLLWGFQGTKAGSCPAHFEGLLNRHISVYLDKCGSFKYPGRFQ